jgi:hypothetical protein
MTRSHICIAVVEALLLISGICLAGTAFAGQVRIIATRDYCNLEVRQGKSNNPDANSPFYAGPVPSGWSRTGDEGNFVCYRREGNPGVCPSGMGYWVCNSNSTSGVEDHDIY